MNVRKGNAEEQKIRAKIELFAKINSVLSDKMTTPPKQWLRSSEVKKLLGYQPVHYKIFG